ncbi:MAG: hypothetical protein KC478_07805 [Bacteriovoracaceae bacterium]|nr:hypothetical protein [Bacteriovoracaceae bacterium]
MKKLIILSLFISQSVFANCICTALLNGKYYFEKETLNQVKCQELLVSQNVQSVKNGRLCGSDEKSFELNWACGEKSTKKLTKKSFSCKEIQGMISAQTLMSATLYASTFTSAASIAPTKLIQTKDCGPSEIQPPSAAATNDSIVLEIEDDKDLKETLEKLFPENKSKVGDIFDQIKNGSFTFWIHNDNSVTDLVQGGGSDDIGNTHGVKVSFSKAIGDAGYKLSIDYESNLFTNFTTGDRSGFWSDEQGNWHVDQNFIEENLGKVVLEKQAQGSAFYWKAGGGVHQLNKSDGKGALGAFSALGSQIAWHKLSVKARPGSARLYSNKGQEGDELAPFLEVGAGKRYTTFEGTRTRGFLDGNVESRISGVEGSSYIAADANLTVDYQLNSSVAARASAGHKSKVYVDGSETSGQYIEVLVGSEKYQAGIKYDFLDGKVPDYQNALPAEFVNRQELAAKEENLWTLFMKYNWQ